MESKQFESERGEKQEGNKEREGSGRKADTAHSYPAGGFVLCVPHTSEVSGL